jgi:hypothetical protein
MLEATVTRDAKTTTVRRHGAGTLAARELPALGFSTWDSTRIARETGEITGQKTSRR